MCDTPKVATTPAKQPLMTALLYGYEPEYLAIAVCQATASLPFEAGDHKRVAFKIVDSRVIKSPKVIPVA